jgi:hypothetical protein
MIVALAMRERMNERAWPSVSAAGHPHVACQTIMLAPAGPHRSIVPGIGQRTLGGSGIPPRPALTALGADTVPTRALSMIEIPCRNDDNSLISMVGAHGLEPLPR